MKQKIILSHTDAMTMLSTIRERADQSGDALAVAIVDEHGALLAFLRTDDCRLSSIQIAQNKAYTAAREHVPSKTLGQSSKANGFPMTNFGELRYVTWGGGLPIIHEGEVIGGIGVSGLTEDEDIDYAEYALKVWQGKS